jgi:hypothetical protein
MVNPSKGQGECKHANLEEAEVTKRYSSDLAPALQECLQQQESTLGTKNNAKGCLITQLQATSLVDCSSHTLLLAL